MLRSFVAVFVAALAFPAHAETLHLTLADAVRMALRGGTPAQLARSAAERARVAQEEAFGGLLPQVNASFQRYSQSINLQTFGFSFPGQPPVVGPFNVSDAQLAAAMQVFNLAALNRYRATQQSVAASRYAVQAADNDLAAAVARLYLVTERAATQIASRQADVTLFERLLKQAEDEFAAGTGTRLDVAQANVQLARARQALLVAQNDRQNAVLALLNAIGADESADVTLDATIPMPPATQPPVTDLLSRARAQRPELAELNAQEKAARLALDAARAQRLPSVGFDYVGDLSGNKTTDLRYSRRIAGVLSMPLLRSDIRADIANATIALHDVETNRAQRERDVEQDVRRALTNVQNAEARAAVASANVKVAEEALTIARDRRSAGYGSPVEVDRAEDNYRQAREDLIAAEADAAAAEYDLQHATGDIARLTTAEPAR